MEKYILYIFLLLNFNSFSQEIKLDTIQQFKNKDLFHITLTTNGFDFIVSLKNISSKNIYWVDNYGNFIGSNNEINFISMGQSGYILDDWKYYNISTLKPNETIVFKDSPNSVAKPMKIEITLYKKRNLSTKNGEIKILKEKYHSNQISFEYFIPLKKLFSSLK